MSPGNTRTGSVLEDMVLPALRHGGWAFKVQERIGKRLGLGAHKADVADLIDRVMVEIKGAGSRQRRNGPTCRCRASVSSRTQRAASGSNTIRSRVRVACANRSSASVDGRTVPPSMRAM